MYWITAFGTVTLPQRGQGHDIGSGHIQPSIVDAAGHVIYDGDGTGQTRMGSREIAVRGQLYDSDAGTLESLYQDLLGMVGKRDSLYRVWDNSGGTQYITARCLGVDSERTITNRYHADVTMRFQTVDAVWQGTAQEQVGTLAAANFWNGTLTNSGNAIQRDVTITVTAGSAAFNYVTLTNSTTGHVSDLQAGTAVAGTLVIDTGALTVTADGTAQYSTFALGSSHAIDDWFRLAPGGNDVTITVNGAATDATFTISWRDAWA